MKLKNRISNLYANLKYLSRGRLEKQREQDITYITKKLLDDVMYEYRIATPEKQLSILDQEASLTQLETKPKSFVRLGDGEVRLMWGEDQAFQKYEQEVVDRLFDILSGNREDLYVGINWGYFFAHGPEVRDFFRRNAYDYRQFFLEQCNPQQVYMDSECTFYDFKQVDTPYYDNIFLRWRKLFEGRDIAIVCGDGILDGFEHDIFDLAASKQFIYGPRRHAWDVHDELVKRINDEVSRDKLVVFILGMAGKAMIPELTDVGYMCWDLGHLAKHYNAYMSKMPATEENIRKIYDAE